jgi:hypothetical protein
MHAMSRPPATGRADAQHEPDLTRIQFDLAYARSWMLLGWTLLKDTAGGLGLQHPHP